MYKPQPFNVMSIRFSSSGIELADQELKKESDDMASTALLKLIALKLRSQENSFRVVPIIIDEANMITRLD